MPWPCLESRPWPDSQSSGKEPPMAQDIPAIDFMYYVATPEFMEQWDEPRRVS